MKYCILFLLGVCLLPFSISSQTTLSAEQILDKSIQYHDPANQLYSKDLSYYFDESRPNGSTRKTMVRLAPRNERFQIASKRDGKHILTDIEKGNVRYFIDGKGVIDTSILRSQNLFPERSFKMRNYYLYLWHLPIKLLDPGTLIDRVVKMEEFNGIECYKLGVRYAEGIGDDRWYFYFSKKNFALVGYRFYHDESQNDGEYIYLEDELVYDLVRIPKTRKWYTHKEDKYLGTDSLVKIEENIDNQ